jgi:Tol biopolymer transport system component
MRPTNVVKTIAGATLAAALACDSPIEPGPSDGAEIYFDIPGDTTEMGLKFLPGKEKLLFIEREYEGTTIEAAYISVYDPANGDVERVIGGDEYYWCGGAVSPDGTMMVYTWKHGIWLMNPFPDGPSTLIVEDTVAGGMKWLPDNEHITYSSVSEIFKLNVFTLDRELLLSVPYWDLDGGYSPEGKFFLVVRSRILDFEHQAYVELYDGETMEYIETLFTHEDGILGAGFWSRDSSKFYLIGYRTADSLTADTVFYIYNFNTGALTQVTYADRSDEFGIATISSPPDADKIVFSTERHIYIIDNPLY